MRNPAMHLPLSSLSKRAFSLLTLACLSLSLALSACKSDKTSGDSKAGDDKKGLRIAVIPKGTTHEFWKSVHAGAAKASKELDVELLWKGPMREDDREDQIKVVEDAISRRVDAIAIAPLDDKALVGPLEDARREGIPVVVFDSSVQWDKMVSFVATDNYKGGALGAERMGELLEGKGKIIVMRYHEGSASTEKREAGFLETIKKKFPEIEVLSENQYAGATAETAYQTAENLLTNFKEVDGIFCPNESTTFGMLRALQDSGRAGKVKFVGFDSSEKLVAAVKKGELHGLVLQDPFKMGELSVRALVDNKQGKTPEQRLDTGVHLAKPDNLEEPAIKHLLELDLSKYL